ncbi:unnamed protein product [Bubo scandiacus]
MGGEVLFRSVLLLLLGKLRFECSDQAEFLLVKWLHKRMGHVIPCGLSWLVVFETLGMGTVVDFVEILQHAFWSSA